MRVSILALACCSLLAVLNPAWSQGGGYMISQPGQPKTFVSPSRNNAPSYSSDDDD